MFKGQLCRDRYPLGSWLSRSLGGRSYSGLLVNLLSEGKKKKNPKYVAFASFSGVNSATMADFRLPTA